MCGVAECGIADLVNLPGPDESNISLDCLLQDVISPVKLWSLSGFGESNCLSTISSHVSPVTHLTFCVIAHWHVTKLNWGPEACRCIECGDASAGRSDPLGQSALRRQFKLDLTSQIHFLKHFVSNWSAHIDDEPKWTLV